MKTQIIPAQITTVEDKIAGSLNFTQILLLMIPVFVAAFIYIGLPPKLIFSLYKIIVIGLITILSIILSLRIRGKVLLEWLGVYLRYTLRPKYYVFNKNEEFGRKVVLPEFIKAASTKEEKQLKKSIHSNTESLPVQKLVKLEQLLSNPDVNISFNTRRRGGLNVAFSKVRS